jgi:putative transposase
MLKKRSTVYEQARQDNPSRWSAQTRDWTFINTVHLNPDSPQTKEPGVATNAA